MNKFASFKFSDAAGINTLLEKYPLASGTNVFASNGEIIVQYQDGEDETPAARIVELKEQIRVFRKTIDEIVHSNKVMETLRNDATSRVDLAQAEINKLEAAIDECTSAAAKKPLKEQLALAEQTLKDRKNEVRDVQSQIHKNEHEVTRIELNIELFRERIEDIERSTK